MLGVAMAAAQSTQNARPCARPWRRVLLQTLLSEIRCAAATPEGHVALAGCKGTGEVHEAPVKGHPLRLASESISKGEKGQGQENAC